MKSSLRKLRDFTLHKSASRDKRAATDIRHQHGDDIETLAPSMQVLTGMQEQYDGLLAAAQSISGSSYDFSRSIHEMASYMVETFGKTGDGDIGSSFSMLAKVQYEISKLLDLYAAHVSQTIIKPTENLLKELESVEEIRRQYELKRDFYNQMRLQKPKGRRKKGDLLDQQLSTIKEQLNEQATQLDLRFQSLKHGQELSLMTQAARHHKAQVHLFAKGLNSLNAVESMIKQLSREFHIDETLSEGESGLQMNEDIYEAEADFLENNVEDASTSSSPGSSQPMTAERREHRAVGTPKPWENTSKSAPLHPSYYAGTINAPVILDLDIEGPSEKVTTYALPSPTGPAARCNNQVVNKSSRADELHVVELPELRRIRTGIATASEEARGLTGLLQMEAYNQSDVRHALGREEAHAWKENRGLHRARRSPSHSYSTSFSEGLEQLSASSHVQSGFPASTPTSSYTRATRENDVNIIVTHLVDPLYKSGPVGRSAPWGLAPSRVSPCASPPVSHLSPPLISELHKLPAPPPPPPPPPPPKLEPVITHSAPLGTKPGRKSTTVTPTVSYSAASSVKKSRSIPSSVDFAQNLHHTKLIKSDDSPVVESP